MSTVPTTNLVAWIAFIFIATSTSDVVHRHLTRHRVEFNFDHEDDFPNVLPLVLKSPGSILNFNFTKTELNYNVPVYMRTKQSEKIVTLDMPPITDAGFYEDPRYGASLTLHCKGHGHPPHTRKYCNIRLISGFFHFDGHKHVIEPEEKDFKRVSILARQNPNNKFMQKHRVYKLTPRNHSCDVKQNLGNTLNQRTNIGNERYKRSKPKYTIEVMALITEKDLTNEEHIKKLKIYYTHVFWGVNLLYNNIDTTGASFGVNLIGFIVEPDSTSLYQYGNITTRDYLNGSLTLNFLAEHESVEIADHVVMFSKHNISDIPSTVGLANVGAMCTPQSVSLCRVLGSFEETHVVAHEIGHSLDSVHDGDGNLCQANAGYIMTAATISNPSTQQILNSFKFSRCSLDDIKSYVTQLSPPNCLLTTVKPAITPTIPTGQLYPPSEQCKTSSNLSGLCSLMYNKNGSEICQTLICRKDENTCKTIVPAYKTTCGNKKWCIFGECVYDVNAPAANDNCLFGDDNDLKYIVQYPDGSSYKPKNCSDILIHIPQFCTNSLQRTSCCKTCSKNTESEKNLPPSSSTPLTSWLSFYLPSNGLSAAGYLRSQCVPVLGTVFYLFQLKNYFVR